MDDDEFDDEELLKGLPSAYDTTYPANTNPNHHLDSLQSNASGMFQASPFMETFFQEDQFLNAKEMEISDTNKNENENNDSAQLDEENSFLIKGENGVCRRVRSAEKRPRKEDNDEDEDDTSITTNRRRAQLLNTPFQTILQEALQHMKEEDTEKAYQQLERDLTEDFSPRLSGSRPTTLGELWVSKYSPRSFREALSDETINLSVLQWLRSWDRYVFLDSEKENTVVNQQQSDIPAEPVCILTGPPGVGKTTLAHIVAAHCGYEPVEINASFERTASRLESLIRSVVSAPGKALARRVEKRTTNNNENHNNTNLLDQLLKPRCLIIDEVDGIAANVAQFLCTIRSHIQRPIICLCNDLYVPSLRPLRLHYPVIFHLPPIHPQRLLLRLEEVCLKEKVTVPQTVLADLVQLSHGDIRSCLNTLQFLQVALQKEMQNKNNNNKMAQAEFLTHQIREIQGKDSSLSGFELYKLIFHKLDRTRSIQKLKKECNVDYESLLSASAASAQKHRLLLQRQAREKGRLSGSVPIAEELTTTDHEVPVGFRVDPYYYYLSHLLRHNGGGDPTSNNNNNSAATLDDNLMEALFENYLAMSYSDYSFSHTTAAAGALSTQDVLTSSAFRDQQSLIYFANKYKINTALEVHCHCSSTRAERVQPVREKQQLRHIQSQSMDVIHSFQKRESNNNNHHSHRGGAALLAFLTNTSLISTDLAPFLMRCLFDVSLRLPSHRITDVKDLSPIQQKQIQQSVERHALYGLAYRSKVKKEFNRNADNNNNNQTMFGQEEPPSHWVLEPDLALLGGIHCFFPNEKENNNDKTNNKPWKKFNHPNNVVKRSFPQNAIYEPKEELKELIMNELNKYYIRGSADTDVDNHSKNNKRIKKETPTQIPMSEPAKTSFLSPVEEVHSNSNSVTAPTAVKKDFFGRIITTNNTNNKKTNAQPNSKNTNHNNNSVTQVRYVYHDGATNAVKIPTVMEDFCNNKKWFYREMTFA
ncbi:hypothetical protein AGDE_13743 [Angomonas deanei]|uniref:ATPase family associated with various cellular activities (AAA)/AAA domain (Dynein-related subfamily), putative n=1 Tax=Angomonas deanei TaxID=59799 RepID=A0A7G2CPE0_9TRYP|nr:hypothetical protein AGDE_13743 [Angomonas deanei]CAD2221716.1 ATPase family associated with various cellular activities (AAA)/AAA domain (dynein-related subfamily), putative [Angomonas deanei]|eukprot:EPY21795.1 hypothetical protein AGDE_13743 [Angomonas deanei]